LTGLVVYMRRSRGSTGNKKKKTHYKQNVWLSSSD
jgi:hypothetical protein